MRSACRSIALIAGFGCIASNAHATILTFDQQRDAATGMIVGPTTSGGVLPTDYGDGVTGGEMAVAGGVFTYGEDGEGYTPDVSVEIFSSASTEDDAAVRLWQTGYGDLANVVFSDGPGTGGSPILNIRLSAAPGFQVDLLGFDLAAFGADLTIAGVDIFDGSSSLLSLSDVLIEGNTGGTDRTTFDFETAYSGRELLLVLDLSNLAASAQDNIGIDNIRFGQTPIPEPGTATLLILGLAGLASLQRRAA